MIPILLINTCRPSTGSPAPSPFSNAGNPALITEDHNNDLRPFAAFLRRELAEAALIRGRAFH